MKEIIQKECPSIEEAELAINAACNIITPKVAYVKLDPEQILTNAKKFSSAQVLLYSYYFRDKEDLFPPGATDGDTIMKVDSKNQSYLMAYGDGLWRRREAAIDSIEPLVAEPAEPAQHDQETL